MTTELKIYVACLASYNNGVLHGAWLDVVGKSSDELYDEITKKIYMTSKFPNVLIDCPYCEAIGVIEFENGKQCPACKGAGKVAASEEYAIHDHEGFHGLIGEYSSMKEVAAIGAVAEELSEDDFEAFAKYAAHVGGGDLPDVSDFQDHYHGTWETFQAYAENYADDTGLLQGVAEHIAQYFDMKAWADDLENDYFTEEVDGGVAVFSH